MFCGHFTVVWNRWYQSRGRPSHGEKVRPFPDLIRFAKRRQTRSIGNHAYTYTVLVLRRGTKSSSSAPEKQRASRDSPIEGDLYGGLVLELPIELVPVFERLAMLPPDDVSIALGRAIGRRIKTPPSVQAWLRVDNRRRPIYRAVGRGHRLHLRVSSQRFSSPPQSELTSARWSWRWSMRSGVSCREPTSPGLAPDFRSRVLTGGFRYTGIIVDGVAG